MDEQRAEFETAYRKAFGKRWVCPQRQDMFKREINRYAHLSVQDMWVMWQAATQRQQERIAELEAQVEALKPKADHFEETVAMWSHAYNNALHEADAHRRMRLEAEAQVQALSLDAGRWKTFISLPSAIRAEWACNLSLVPVLTQWIDQAAINAAVESQKEQS